MSERELPGWIVAVDAAALRLEAEVEPEVDEVLAQAAFHGEAPRLLIDQAARLKQSADLTEVATDLAGLLWADDADVPPIASILDEPAAQGSLEAVAAQRRAGARRLAVGALAPPAARSAAWPVPDQRRIWPERSMPVERRADLPPAKGPAAAPSSPTATPGPSPRPDKAVDVSRPAANLFWNVRRRITRPQT